MGSRVELFAAIRRDARVEGLGIRALADRHGVHRRTVRQALASAEPPGRKAPERAAPKLDPAKPHIDKMLRDDLGAPPKQLALGRYGGWVNMTTGRHRSSEALGRLPR